MSTSCVTLGARGLLASDSALTEGEVHAHYGHGMAETRVKRKYIKTVEPTDTNRVRVALV